MGLYPTTDLALRFDRDRIAADLAIVDGDLALDATPVTPMIVSLGTDRRALADDALPDAISALSAPAGWTLRRGWVGDCLAAAGRRIGSRLWLICREHQDEATRRRAEDYVAEALGWATRDLGITPEIEVSWARTGILKIRALIDGRAVTLSRKVV